MLIILKEKKTIINKSRGYKSSKENIIETKRKTHVTKKQDNYYLYSRKIGNKKVTLK